MMLVINENLNIGQINRQIMRASGEHRKLLKRAVSQVTPRHRRDLIRHQISRLRDEMQNQGLGKIQISTYFGDEWFCPSGSTSIAIPFWLNDERLIRLEKQLIGYAEGETEDEFMRLLRHEAGHCVDHAFRLSRLDEWRKLFGNPMQTYHPDSIPELNEHDDYVTNLGGGYAQTHPEEDFAETFAVWLQPNSRWKSEYRNKPNALKKLQGVDDLMRRLRNKRPNKTNKSRISSARRTQKSLGEFYARRLGGEIGRVLN